MNGYPSLKIAYISRRPFPDGPVKDPFPESDPANIAHILDGDYFSFFTFGKLSQRQIQQRLAVYDLIFLAMDHRALETVELIARACDNRLVTYSEGNIADYQMHSPAGQTTFLRIINEAQLNFIYWEKYLPFYRTLTDRPVEYLPYPYLYEDAGQHRVSITDRRCHVTLPSGLAGHTRNGLGSLAVARQLLRQDCIEQVNCWLSAVSFAEDAQAIQHFILGSDPPRRSPRLSWRKWLKNLGFDYRILLRLREKLRPSEMSDPPPPVIQTGQLALYRRRTWLHYLPEMAKTKLVIDMNTRETVGRNSLDCAAVGVPCVSTNRSDVHERLFPDLALNDSWDVEEAISLCRRLLRDESFYQTTTERAGSGLTQFGPAAFRRRMESVFRKHPQLLATE